MTKLFTRAGSDGRVEVVIDDEECQTDSTMVLAHFAGEDAWTRADGYARRLTPFLQAVAGRSPTADGADPHSYIAALGTMWRDLVDRYQYVAFHSKPNAAAGDEVYVCCIHLGKAQKGCVRPDLLEGVGHAIDHLNADAAINEAADMVKHQDEHGHGSD